MNGNVTNVIGNTTENIASTVGKGTASFMTLMKDFNVIGFVLGLLMSTSVSEIATSLIDSIIMPTIKPFLDRVSNTTGTIQIGDIQLHLTKFINAILKFIVLALIIFVFITFGVKVTKPVAWVKIVE